MRRTRHIYSILLIILFCLMLLFVFANDVFRFYTPPPSFADENRTISKKPVFDLNLLDPYPKAYTAYYNDIFPLRSDLKYLNTIYQYYVFHESSDPGEVLIGRHGWFFYCQKEKQIYEGTYILSDKDIRGIVDELGWRDHLLKELGIKFYIAIAPMKSEIYPENVPAGFYRSTSGTSTDKLIAAIKKDGRINFIDLKEPLIGAKKSGRLYQVTDNHWNSKGAFVAYSEIMKRIGKDFPAIRPVDRSDIEFRPFTRNGGNLANMLGLSSLVKESDFKPVIRGAKAKPAPSEGFEPPPGSPIVDEYEFDRQVEDPSLPVGLVIRDSFGFPLMPFLDENFRKSVYIFDSWRYGFHKEIIEKLKPDLVLVVIYEPHLLNVIDPYR
ncbi:MAG TPA: hypothetical protein VMC08_06185 [Bacteroidales bacterium]|nr:hypothetical protein [Bacteroidales bacterium]